MIALAALKVGIYVHMGDFANLAGRGIVPFLYSTQAVNLSIDKKIPPPGNRIYSPYGGRGGGAELQCKCQYLYQN